MESRSAVFLDRDGVINEKMPEGDYVKSWEEFKFLPGVVEAISLLKKGDYLTILVTNQRGVAKGFYTVEQLNQIHEKMCEAVRKNGGDIDAIYFCPHEETDECRCRKPKPGMFEQAIKDFKTRGIEIDTNTSYMVGDSEKDIMVGNSVGLRAIKVGETSPGAFATVCDLTEATDLIVDV